MKIRQIQLDPGDRRRLMDLVQEVSAELDKIESEAELDVLEEELGMQWFEVLEQQARQEAAQNKIQRLSWNWLQTRWVAPSLGLAALVLFSVTRPTPVEDPNDYWTMKGGSPIFSCDIKMIQQLPESDGQQILQADLQVQPVYLIRQAKLYIAVACPQASPLQLQILAESGRETVIETDPVGHSLAVLKKNGANIALDAGLKQLSIHYQGQSRSFHFESD